MQLGVSLTCSPASATFSLALAAGRAVHAVESDAAALGALAATARRAQLVQVTTERRDLETRPLLPDELAGYDAVIFDPPRAGAKAQAEQLRAPRYRSSSAYRATRPALPVTPRS
ncbi:MAG: hypothetical protein WDN69_08545 [Aliidongia sp.]